MIKIIIKEIFIYFRIGFLFIFVLGGLVWSGFESVFGQKPILKLWNSVLCRVENPLFFHKLTDLSLIVPFLFFF